MRRTKLVIISHTEHYIRDGSVVGWGPTVNEIDFLGNYWDEVVHLGCLYDSAAPKSSIGYTRPNVRFEAMPPSGGPGIRNKIGILMSMPFILYKVLKLIRNASEVQFRAPTAIGVFLLPFLSIIPRRRFVFWTKYAGNWGAPDAPLSYRFQRWWLAKNFAGSKVTINGTWKNQPKHCFSFENPCLSEDQIIVGKECQKERRFAAPFRLVFVGRLNEEKGVGRILEALERVERELVARVDFVGGGQDLEKFKRKASEIPIEIRYHGFLSGPNVHAILKNAHFLLLPSSSEGFPKVIAEAACYGCIPVVSDVGSITVYVRTSLNGFVWQLRGQEQFDATLKHALTTNEGKLMERSENLAELAELFTFEKYLHKLETEIFTDQITGK